MYCGLRLVTKSIKLHTLFKRLSIPVLVNVLKIQFAKTTQSGGKKKKKNVLFANDWMMEVSITSSYSPSGS